MSCSINPTINIDTLDCYEGLFDILAYLQTTRVLERLYGRKIAQKYFTSHFKSDSITLTV